MTNDERKLLEDRIVLYGDAKKAESQGFEFTDAAWDRLMDTITKIQKKEEKHE